MKKLFAKKVRPAALKIIAIYALFAALWIYFSDEALGLFITDSALIVRISVIKGFLFIIVTAVLLYHLISRYMSAGKRAQETQDATIDLLWICNEAGSKRALMQELVNFFQKFTGCEAIGVRLKEGDDFPYYEARGFPAEFVEAENSLCIRDQAGQPARDHARNPVLDCMCGNVLAGRFDPARPFFTLNGSFWTNSTTRLLATTTEAERKARTRNRCNGEGYESVALVPLRSGGKTFGLLQFNDRRTGRFSGETMALLENLAASVATTLGKLQVDEALSESCQFSNQIINSAEEGIIVYGPDMRYQVWNPYMERLSGRMASEVIGRHPLEAFPFLREAGVIEIIGKAVSGQPFASVEFSRSFPAASPRWISDTCVPLRNTKGEIIGAIGTVIDITERKLAEERLQEATQRLELALSAGHLGIWDWDIVNDLLVWNERMFELYGVSKDKFRMSREKWEKCLHPDDLAMALEATRAALNG
ncbi:MAG TPA: PAS domain-containing protein, partial [Geobacteraceae bacterium]|nr:PAS domain-containing protein [Geobacteraceae bacterium]